MSLYVRKYVYTHRRDCARARRTRLSEKLFWCLLKPHWKNNSTLISLSRPGSQFLESDLRIEVLFCTKSWHLQAAGGGGFSSLCPRLREASLVGISVCPSHCSRTRRATPGGQLHKPSLSFQLRARVRLRQPGPLQAPPPTPTQGLSPRHVPVALLARQVAPCWSLGEENSGFSPQGFTLAPFQPAVHVEGRAEAQTGA